MVFAGIWGLVHFLYMQLLEIEDYIAHLLLLLLCQWLAIINPVNLTQITDNLLPTTELNQKIRRILDNLDHQHQAHN